MIVISIAVLSILLLIACVGLHVLNEGVKEAHVVASNYEKDWLEEMQQRTQLEAKLAELQTTPEPSEEEPETGNFVKRRAMRRATPETYRNIFDLDINGQRVLENLTIAFCKDAYASQDQGGERETCYRLGQQSVINFIVRNINTANSPNYKEQSND